MVRLYHYDVVVVVPGTFAQDTRYQRLAQTVKSSAVISALHKYTYFVFCRHMRRVLQ